MEKGHTHPVLNPKFYQTADPQIWQGRNDGDQPEHQRWHQKVRLLDLNRTEAIRPGGHRPIVLLGFSCDEGVRRNKGRTGAEKGPEAIRKALSSLPVHAPHIQICDAGNITCPGGDLETAQAELGHAVHRILKAGGIPMVLGGGHEVTYGHYCGVRQSTRGRLGIINFDAHFDNRTPGMEGASSGTGFWQIQKQETKLKSVTEQHIGFHYLALGIQRSGNTQALFDQANSSGTRYLLAEEFKETGGITQIEQFLMEVDQIYLTIDMDVFASAYAPGVSAPAALGLTPDPLFFRALTMILRSGKLLSLDIAELNPSLDQDGRTAKLAASLIFYSVENMAKNPVN